MSAPTVEESMMTSPTGAGERRGLPRNLHWIIIGILGLVLAVVIMSAAVQKEETAKDRKTESDKANRQAVTGVEKPVDPAGFASIQREQEAAVAPTITLPSNAKLPPVPQRDGKNIPVEIVGKGDARSADADLERIRREQQRQESITGAPILALKGKSVKADEMAQRVAELAGTDPAAMLTKAKNDALAAVTNRGTEMRSAMGSGGAGNPFAPGAGGPSPAGVGGGIANAKNLQWLQGQSTQPSSQQALRVESPASQTVVFQGTIVPVVLVTALNSDMPGQIVAMATSDVYDSIQGNALIIPRGSKFYGQYNSEVQIGQERALAAFQRLLRPDGSHVNLQGMPATDSIGQAGVAGDVNNHFFKMFGASFAVAGLAHLFDKNRNQSVVVSGGTNGNSSLSGAAGEILVDISKRVTQRNSNLSATITVPAGERFNVTVTKDIDIPPYRQRVPGQ